MKICFLTQTLNQRTGAGVFASNIVDRVSLSRPDIRFSVITGEDYLRPGILNIFRNWSHIRNQVKEADIVHAIDGFPYGVIACLANLGTSKPVIITVIGSGSIGKLSGYGLQSFLLRWAYRRAARITAISNYISNEVQKVLPNLSIIVINPGVDYDFYSKEDNKKYSLIPNAAYVVTQGEFKERKGYMEILPMMKKVIGLRPSVNYVIIGNTGRNQDYQEKLYNKMDKLGIRNKIFVLSDLSGEELRAAFKDAILYFTLPKNHKGDVEGFGMAIMEAAATGTPVVVGKGSGADDAVSDGQSGFLVDGKNEKEVIERILTIIDNRDLRDRLSKGAKKWASENSWESKVRQYVSLYEQI